MKVMLADIETDALASAIAKLHDFGPNVHEVRCDVADPASVERAAKASYEAFGNVHVVCNNAGVGGGRGIDNVSLETWRWVIDVNLMGVLHGIRTFLPHIRAHGEGGQRNEFPPIVPQHDEHMEQPETDGRDDEEIDGGDAGRMIAKKGLPVLGRRSATPRHIFGHRCLTNLDAELQQLAMDTRRTPQRISEADLPDKAPSAHRDSRTAAPRPGSPAPKESEAPSVPTKDRLRTEQRHRIEEGWGQPIQSNEDQAIEIGELWFLWRRALQNAKLMPKDDVFSHEPCPRPDHRE
jgi:hypothetical protein